MTYKLCDTIFIKFKFRAKRTDRAIHLAENGKATDAKTSLISHSGTLDYKWLYLNL